VKIWSSMMSSRSDCFCVLQSIQREREIANFGIMD